MRELRPVPELRASGSKVQAARAATRRACCACAGPGCVRAGEKGVGMPRRPGTDRWLFGATLALRQIAWLVLGLAAMILLMLLDYRRLRETAAVISVVSLFFAMILVVLFLDK